MAKSQAPKFGNWDGEEVAYTMYFDNARKGRKTDQQYESDLQANIEAELKDQKASEQQWRRREQHSSIEEGDIWRSIGSPNVTGRKSSSNSPHHRHGGDTPRRAARQSGASDRSVDHSPLHPYSTAKIGGKSNGISSPSWERVKVPSEGNQSLAPSTPGRSRLRSVTRGDESPDRSPAVPKFGGWDETDPSTSEDYSQIFSKVREEKHSETGKVPVMPTEISYSNGQKLSGNDTPRGCSCFPWGKR